MRYFLSLVLTLTVVLASAQVKGNKNIITKEFSLEEINRIQIHLYADVVIDCAAKESLTISADENLMDLIDVSADHGRLILDQAEWIKPSQDIQIRIGAPNLEQIQQSTHERVLVKNIDTPSFRAMALVGEIVVQGEAKELRASGEVGIVNAEDFKAEVVNVNLWGWGTIKLDEPKLIEGIVKDGGTVLYKGSDTKVKVRKSGDGKVLNPAEQVAIKDPSAEFIDLEIKNNSPKRIQAYVVGPKPDGRKFSYGFPINPGQVKKKKWSVGTKVYRVSKVGTKKKLVEITKEDEGQVVPLYGEK
ncbi:MAG: DUF2807 domain-containing protein [Saprospiraceae bacterium]|nr:DUF2807 domain-containing protein [Saprospiraceae bacterium]